MGGETRKQKILGKAELSKLRERHPNAKITHCHGVFDVLHAGHLAYFESARKFGDLLVVTVTADKHVNKGPGRPYFNSTIRMNMLAALEVVDYVALSDYPTAIQVLETLRPDFYVKGPDYRDKSLDVTGAILDEESAVKRGGGQLVFTNDETHSSSNLINEFFYQWSEEQQACIARVKQLGGLARIEEVLNGLKNIDVQIIGEPIIDSYVFCRPEAISSKSPSISAKYLYEESYTGGSLAIANHLCDFAKSVQLICTHGGEPAFNALLKENLDPRVQLTAQELANVPTPRKTRYITEDNKQRMFEITHLRSDQWDEHSPKEFCELLRKRARFDGATIVADFGHGLFEGPVLQTLQEFQGFVGLNVQTNSSNYGFNPYKKHKRFSYLSIDLKEARIAYHDRYASHAALAQRIQSDFEGQKAFSMTMGSSGALFYSPSFKNPLITPAFADQVVDAIGAGDAYFGLTSLLVKADCPHELVPFLGNVFAGLKTRIIGNKRPVTRAQLLKAVTSILK